LQRSVTFDDHRLQSPPTDSNRQRPPTTTPDRPRPPPFTGLDVNARQMNADALLDLDQFRPPRWLRWLAVAVVAGGIFYASLLAAPTSGLAPLGPLGLIGVDKWLHALAYVGLAGTLAVALVPGRRTRRVAVLALVFTVGYGVAIEFAQAPLPERAFSVADMVANAIGAMLGAAVASGLLWGISRWIHAKE
jgi:VanZ family protein